MMLVIRSLNWEKNSKAFSLKKEDKIYLTIKHSMKGLFEAIPNWGAAVWGCWEGKVSKK